MSLVITSNQDTDVRNATDQSIYSAYSYRNEIASTYKIPRNSQVCLQSAKVNLDGRAQLSAKNTVYYEWFGVELDQDDEDAIDLSTSYPIKQVFGEKGKILELTPEEVAVEVQNKHIEYHPNKKGFFECNASQDANGAFTGYDFISKQNISNGYITSGRPTVFTKFFNSTQTRFSYNSASFIFTRNGSLGEAEVACVGIGLQKPLSLANGSSFEVDFSNANASGAPWGIGLSRYTPNHEQTGYFPQYFDTSLDVDDSNLMVLDSDDKNYFEDIGVHRNIDGELVIRQAVPLGTGEMGYREVKYYNNASSDIANPDTRYDLIANTNNYQWIRFVCKGEQIAVYIGHSGATDLVTQFTAGQGKNTYPKPISQTMWCLHPVLSVSANGSTVISNSLTINKFAGLPVASYDPTASERGGWYENYAVLKDSSGLAQCQEVDFRVINDPNDATVYTPKGLNASGAIDYKPAMIVSPNKVYTPTQLASTADVFGFGRNGVINDGTTALANSLYSLTFSSSELPNLTSTSQSIFIRLRNFGQQVLNARAKTKSTIIAQLPTADEDIAGVGKLFYEPNRDVWLDLNNSEEIVVSDFNIDLIYVNEQYAKVLEGQTIVVLYFRPKPADERRFE